MNKLTLSCGCFLVIVFLVHSVQAHIGDRIYPIYEITDEDLMEIDVRDGTIGKWSEILSESSVTAAEFTFKGKSSGRPEDQYDPSDLDFRIWLGWNRSRNLLFLAYEGVDDIYINEYAGGDPCDPCEMMHHDHIEFIVDGDHSGGRYNLFHGLTEEEEKLNTQRTAQQYRAIAVAPDDRHVGFSHTNAAWVNVPPYTEGGGRVIGENPTISIIEFFVTPFDDLIWDRPEESISSELFPGKIIGFDIVVWEYDTEPMEVQGIFSLTGDDVSWMLADRLVDGILVGIDGVESDDTSVENDTWGRIKASFISD